MTRHVTSCARPGACNGLGMKRTPPLALLLPLVLLLLPLTGCQTYFEALEDNPVSTRIFWGGAVVGAVPGVVAGAPITLPLTWAGAGDCHGLLPFLPGFPTGFVTGVALSLPPLLVESLLRLPFRGSDPEDAHEGALEPPPCQEGSPAESCRELLCEEHLAAPGPKTYADWPRAAELEFPR